MIDYLRFPEGKTRVVTFSYDDGPQEDEQLIALFNKYGVKATFHLNSGHYRHHTPEQLTALRALYAGHEIACHTADHGHLPELPSATMVNQIMDDRKALEKIAGYPVTGMSYPFGTVSAQTINALRACGITYSRTTGSTNYFHIPRDFLQWHPTCHHKTALERCEAFLADLTTTWRAPLFYIWGHSFEFKTLEDWAYMEQVVSALAGKDEIWYATNGEIFAYRQAQEALAISADESIIHNPSAIPVWVNKNHKSVHIPAGETVYLD